MILSSPQARRVKAPGWLDIRLILGIALVVGAVVVGALVVAAAGRTRPVLAVTRDLAAGSHLDAGDLSVVQVRLPDGAAGRYLSDRAQAVGRQLDRPLARGELLPAAAVAQIPARTTVNVPLADGAAPGLHTGERIEVWLSTPSCPPVVVLPDVTVQRVRAAETTRMGIRGGQDIVLSLDPPLAERLIAALARDGASVRAGVLSGPLRTASAPDLPDLDTCPAGGDGSR